MKVKGIWEEYRRRNMIKIDFRKFLKTCTLGITPIKDRAEMLGPLNIWVSLYSTSSF